MLCGNLLIFNLLNPFAAACASRSFNGSVLGEGID